MTAACAATRFARPSAGRMTTSAASPASPGCRAASATPRPTAWACAGVCGETAAGCSARHWCAPSRSLRFGGEQQAACPAAPAALQRARPATDLRKRDWMLLRPAAVCTPQSLSVILITDATVISCVIDPWFKWSWVRRTAAQPHSRTAAQPRARAHHNTRNTSLSSVSLSPHPRASFWRALINLLPPAPACRWVGSYSPRSPASRSSRRHRTSRA